MDHAALWESDQAAKQNREAQNYLLDWAVYGGPRRSDGSLPTDVLTALSRVAFPGYDEKAIERLLYPPTKEV